MNNPTMTASAQRMIEAVSKRYSREPMQRRSLEPELEHGRAANCHMRSDHQAGAFAVSAAAARRPPMMALCGLAPAPMNTLSLPRYRGSARNRVDRLQPDCGTLLTTNPWQPPWCR